MSNLANVRSLQRWLLNQIETVTKQALIHENTPDEIALVFGGELSNHAERFYQTDEMALNIKMTSGIFLKVGECIEMDWHKDGYTKRVQVLDNLIGQLEQLKREL